MKKLYFTSDFSPENVANLQEEGFILRDIKAYRDGDTVELCDEAHGEVPEAYADKEVSDKSLNKLTVDELKSLLDEGGIEYKSDDKKADLIELAQST